MARAWLPSDATTATLAGWFDAQDASTFTLIANTDAVSEWRSKAGGTWSVLQADNAKRPIRNAAGYNNLPAVIFTSTSVMSGTDGLLTPAGAQAGIQSGVAAVVSNGPEYATLFTQGNRQPDQLRSVSAHNRSVSVGYFGNDHDGTSGWTGKDRMFAASIDTTGLSKIYVDGAANPETKQLSPLSTPDSAPFYIGAGINGDGWQNPIQEITVWTGLLSTAELDMLFGYYAWRWNLVAQLPANHPYKNAAPTMSGGPSLSAGTSGFTLLARSANVLLGHTLPALPAALTLAGQAIRALAGRSTVASPADFVLGAAGIDLRQSRRLGADPVAFTALPSSTTLVRARIAALSPAALTLTGRSANLLHGYVLPAGTAPFSASALHARLRAARRLVADPAYYAIDAQNVDIERVGRLIIDAEVGQMNALAQPIGLRVSRRLAADRADMRMTGMALAVSRTGRMSAIGAAFTLSGQNAGIRVSRRLASSPIGLAVKGHSVSLRLSRRNDGQRVAFVVSLIPASLTIAHDEGGVRLIGPGWSVRVLPRRFSAVATRRLFIVSSTGCKRMLNFPPKYAHEVRNAVVDFAPALSEGEALTGQPTVVVMKGDLSVTAARIEGTAVHFKLSGGMAATKVIQYVEVHCQTDGNQVLEEVLSVTMLS